MSDSLYIIDAYSQIYRAYFAIRGLRSPGGLPTNAVFGFAQMIMRLKNEHDIDRIVAVFDPPGPTVRDELFDQYKADREPPPDDLLDQIPLIEQYLKYSGIAKIEVPGWEADDVIGYLADWGEKQGWNVFIVSADKDLFQLVTEKTSIIRQEKGDLNTYKPEDVTEKMGVPPGKIADLLALAGDSVDNIPGVKGIGPKSAVRILANFNNVEDMLENVEKIGNPRWRRLIEESRADVTISKQLTVIDPKASIPFDTKKIKFPVPDNKALTEFYREMNFHTLLRDLESSGETAPLPSETRKRELQYHLVTTIDEAKKVIDKLNGCAVFAIDCETTSTDAHSCDLLGVSLSMQPDEAWYLAVGIPRDLFSTTDGIPLAEMSGILAPLLADPKIKKIGHNIKYDTKVLELAGMPVNGVSLDTMVGAYLLNPDRASLSLKRLAYEELGIVMTAISDLIGKGRNQISLLDVPLEEVSKYACADADCTFQLAQTITDHLKNANLLKLYNDVELPLIEILSEMESTGVRIDAKYFAELSEVAEKALAETTEAAFQMCGRPFNLNSPKQLAEILFNELNLPVIKKGKTGPSTDVSVLEALKDQHDLPKLLLRHRSLEKLKNTYIDVMPRLVNAKSGRIHTSYNQTVTATGRLSSSSPNLQNIPVGAAEGLNIRKGFIPLNNGDLLFAADYSQIELRVLAHMSEDPALMDAYKENLDIHTITASKIFKVPLEDVAPAMRAQAKMVNFGVIYGMSARGLQQRLGISYNEAKIFINEYFQAYQGVENWIKKTVDAARDTGYIQTLLNRRRYISDISSKNRTTRSNAERIAVNTPIQGTAADLIKVAMVKIDQRLRHLKLKTQMIMQVHDELIFNVPSDEIEVVASEIKTAMENALPLKVPIVVDIKTGKNWAECK